MRTTIVGTGYVGLVTGACLADLGNDVICMDADRRKVALLREGRIPIHETGLSEIAQRNRDAGRLRFTTDIQTAIAHGDVVFIAVGTPARGDGEAVVADVLQVAADIGRLINRFQVVAVKSTVPVGTCQRVRQIIQRAIDKRASPADFAVISNPEFLREGNAVHDFTHPDRIVLGSDEGAASERGVELIRELYAPFTRAGARLLRMPARAAEFTKYVANAMLATRISFMNEMACLAESIGVDIEEVREGIGSDSRIGPAFLRAGCGYGGSCLPKDVRALLHDANTRMQILEAVEQVNERQKHRLVEKILHRFGSDVAGRRFALWGLAFKPDTNDIRDAPARVLVRRLLEAGASVAVHDPVAIPDGRRAFEGDLAGGIDCLRRLCFAEQPLDALQDADALIIATEWSSFIRRDLDILKRALKTPVVFDGRNLFHPRLMAEAGLEYHAIGRSCPHLP